MMLDNSIDNKYIILKKIKTGGIGDILYFLILFGLFIIRHFSLKKNFVAGTAKKYA